MGLRLRKTIRIAPGIKINLSKTGASLSVGQKGATVNFGRKGVRGTTGVPGTGVSYSQYQSYKGGKGTIAFWVVIAIIAASYVFTHR